MAIDYLLTNKPIRKVFPTAVRLEREAAIGIQPKGELAEDESIRN
jgi:hypothetical protein